MLAGILLGLAGILFLLGVISLQIASLKPQSWPVAIALMLVFLGALILSGVLTVAALSGVATSL